MNKLVGFLLGVTLSVSVAHAQIQIPGTNFTLSPVNGGTGALVSVPIPGGSGLSVTVGTGSAAIPLQDIRNNPNAVNISTWDDWYTEVPLGFTFPFYGQNFTNSWAMTNGLVTFQNPATSGLGGACCEGVDLRTTRDSRYNYTIYGMHTDLYSWTNNQYYLRGTNEMTYGWYNSSQCCSSNGGNSFEIKINSSGLVDTRIAGAMISGNRVTSGMAGDLSKGEFFQSYHGRGINITPGSANIFSWQALGGTGAVDMCTINPLSSPACPGYQAAYTVQQCSISALYDSSCPGYQTAYTTQQCSTNPLFSTACPGYQNAYLQQQCSLNPLFSTTCSGYQQAYENQQCSLNSLYSTNCPGYAVAYLDQQCGINPLYSTTCRGYAAAYHDQQCSISPLYATTCSGYAVAYKTQQCSISALYATDCPGYAQAYFNQQCSLNGLYDRTCPNYSTAYATAEALKQSSPVATTTTTVTTTAPNAPTVDSSGEIKIAVVSDSNVNSVITTTATSASPAAAATATVPLVAAAPAPTAPVVEAKVESKQDSKEEKKDAPSNSVSSTATASNSSSSDSKPAAPTARQEIQARRQEAARAKAVESGKQLANEMGKAADMESQKAIQNVVIAAMGFTPGFDAYGKTVLSDVAGYKPFTVYNNQKNIDSRLNLRMFGGTDRLHSDMVDSQYK